MSKRYVPYRACAVCKYCEKVNWRHGDSDYKCTLFQITLENIYRDLACECFVLQTVSFKREEVK